MLFVIFGVYFNITAFSIIAALLLAALLFLLQNKLLKKEKRENYKDLLNNSFLLVATFLGVFLAIYLADKEAEAEKKKKAIEVLQLSYKALENYYSTINDLKIAGIIEGKEIEGWRLNRRRPVFIALETPELYYAMSSDLYSDLLSVRESITNGLDLMDRADSMSNKVFDNDMGGINCLLFLAAKHIRLEILYQQNPDSMSLENLRQRINQDHINAAKGIACPFLSYPVQAPNSNVLVSDDQLYQ